MKQLNPREWGVGRRTQAGQLHVCSHGELAGDCPLWDLRLAHEKAGDQSRTHLNGRLNMRPWLSHLLQVVANLSHSSYVAHEHHCHCGLMGHCHCHRCHSRLL